MLPYLYVMQMTEAIKNTWQLKIENKGRSSEDLLLSVTHLLSKTFRMPLSN